MVSKSSMIVKGLIVIITLVAFILMNYYAVNKYTTSEGVLRWEAVYLLTYSIPVLGLGLSFAMGS